jgi:hypothetical protein
MNHPPDAMRSAETATADDEAFLQRAARLQQLLRELADVAPAGARERIADVERMVVALCAGAGEPEGVQAGESPASVVETVRSHPVQVAAAAIGAGVLTWWLLDRRA